MGTLYYGHRFAITVDDRTLSHLKIVITSKLRRREGFLLSWTEPVQGGSGRASVWLHAECDLLYRFDGNTSPELDRQLLDEMAQATAGSTGLHIEASLAR